MQLGLDLRDNALLDTLAADITKSSEIEGEILNRDQVRSSVARHLGIETEGLPEADRYVEGVVQVIVLKVAVTHLWFVPIHPFDDGNGRIARTITDLLLARADEMPHRFYSMSAELRKQRKAYYDILEKTQKGTLDITDWVEWFLDCLEAALLDTGKSVNTVLQKAAFWDNHRKIPMNDRQVKMVNLLWDGFEGKLTSSKWGKITKCSVDIREFAVNMLSERFY